MMTLQGQCGWRRVACCLFVALAVQIPFVSAFAFYDPFESVAAIRASDELEERLWAETALLRGPLLQGVRSKEILLLQASVRQHFQREFGELATVVRIHVVDEPELTVVTTPGGDIFLSTGLLLRVRSEAELSALLAREVAHIVNRDTARTLSYAKLGSNLKEVFSTAFAVYNVASGVISATSVLNSFTGMTPESVLERLQLTPEKLLEGGGKMFADYLKTGVQDTIKESTQDFGKNLAGLMVHRLSVQAIAAMIKTSAYGYSERMEGQADEFAFRFLQARYGNTEAFVGVMERLHAQAKVRSLSYLTFYANAARLEARLKNCATWNPDPMLMADARNDLSTRVGKQAAVSAMAKGVPGTLPYTGSVTVKSVVMEPLDAGDRPPPPVSSPQGEPPVLAAPIAVDPADARVDVPAVAPAVEPGPTLAADEKGAEADGAASEAVTEAMGESVSQPTTGAAQDAAAGSVSDVPVAKAVELTTVQPAEKVESMTSESTAIEGLTRVSPASEPVPDFMTALSNAMPEMLRREARDSETSRFLHLTSQSLPSPLVWPADLALMQAELLIKRDRDGDVVRALAMLSYQVDAYPDDWKSAKLAASTYFKLSDFESSLMFYDKAMAAAPDERERIFLSHARERVVRRLGKVHEGRKQ